MNQDAMYGNEEQEKKISDPRTGRWFMAFNIIAMFVLLIVIALKADINQLYDQQIAASKQAYKKPTTPATNTNGAAKPSTPEPATGTTTDPKKPDETKSEPTAPKSDETNKENTNANDGEKKTENNSSEDGKTQETKPDAGSGSPESS